MGPVLGLALSSTNPCPTQSRPPHTHRHTLPSSPSLWCVLSLGLSRGLGGAPNRVDTRSWGQRGGGAQVHTGKKAQGHQRHTEREGELGEEGKAGHAWVGHPEGRAGHCRECMNLVPTPLGASLQGVQLVVRLQRTPPPHAPGYAAHPSRALLTALLKVCAPPPSCEI